MEYAVRYWMLLAVAFSLSPSAGARADEPAQRALPAIPKMVTSFGAAVLGEDVYIYGGHMGGAHSYAREFQANTLYRLSLTDGERWHALVSGPPLQGLAMVAADGALYRLGGFTAKNAKGEDHDLWSQAEVARFVPGEKQFREMPPLPEPRSSFDAAVLDDKIYVIGGWQMRGNQESQWHKTAHVLDLKAERPQWRSLPAPPFERRALSVAAHQGKIYAIGGMQQEGGPTTRVDVFDVESQQWSQGPSLIGKPMDGFGSSSFAVGGRLYASTYAGNLQRLAEDGRSWEIVRELERARFFHRMLPVGDGQLLLIGGANMETGKFSEVDLIDVAAEATK